MNGGSVVKGSMQVFLGEDTALSLPLLPTVLQIAGITLIGLTIALGYELASFSKLDQPSSLAITCEVEIQNGTLAIAVASAPTMLNSPTLAISAAIYSLIMFFTNAAFAQWASRRSARK